ncbi:DivIVA domain-containing protein [Microbacterium sp. STN6]|uniref:DivIVA domain-containing protein n=1 Tax=Microbacterium sp. STN6 TaxID=2995588 RepID=UPI002260E80F|nr:DivIVA domain-containing protein [Microbacterium sp. STN6]MCX7522136.1 DivIVA domain-containing protein [Microbacterium sp. STN6]
MGDVSTFPIARRPRRGYDIDDVEAFLARARSAYDGESGGSLSAEEIRHTAFTLRRRGYVTSAVDAALERLEDVFAAREREEAVRELGRDGWLEQARTTSTEIVARLERPEHARFGRVSILSHGYSVGEVDAFCDRLLDYFRQGTTLTTTDVRTVVFTPKRGGYREWQVDAVLDSVTDVMLAVR